MEGLRNDEGTGRDTLASETASPAPENRSVDGHQNSTTVARSKAYVGDSSSAIYDAERWREDNPDAWAWMVRHALADAEAERHISVYELVERVRMMDFARADGAPLKINNRIRPGLARILARDYPQTAPFIEFRRAACDGMV